MKATEQYFPVVLFIMLYKVALTSESADKSASLVFPYGTVNFLEFSKMKVYSFRC